MALRADAPEWLPPPPADFPPELPAWRRPVEEDPGGTDTWPWQRQLAVLQQERQLAVLQRCRAEEGKAAGGFRHRLHAPHLCGPYQDPTVASTPAAEPVADADAGSRGVRVYCDLDGVLADFNAGAAALLRPELAARVPSKRLTRAEEDEMWEKIEAKSDFFATLPWCPRGEELWRWLDWNFCPAPSILTGLPYGRVGKRATTQKEAWCAAHLGPHVPVICCGTRNKQKYSGRDHILIDDRLEIRASWEAHGGVFVYHTSAEDSIRQLHEALHRLQRQRRRDQSVPRPPLLLSSVCWNAQSPAGCAVPRCPYQHVPISRRHKAWIQLWGFVWWGAQMVDDVDALGRAVDAVYGDPGHLLEPGVSDEQTDGRLRLLGQVLAQLRSEDLGYPFAAFPPPGAPPPAAGGWRAALAELRRAAAAALPGAHLVVVGSCAQGLSVPGSDLDLVLSCGAEVAPLEALRRLQARLDHEGRGGASTNLIDTARAPLLEVRLPGLPDVDVCAEQMQSVRDVLLLRCALATAEPAVAAALRVLKAIVRARLPSRREGGMCGSVWTRLLLRIAQERAAAGRPFASDCEGGRADELLRELFTVVHSWLPTGGTPLDIEGEQHHTAPIRDTPTPPGTLLAVLDRLRQAARAARPAADSSGAADWAAAAAAPQGRARRTADYLRPGGDPWIGLFWLPGCDAQAAPQLAVCAAWAPPRPAPAERDAEGRVLLTRRCPDGTLRAVRYAAAEGAGLCAVWSGAVAPAHMVDPLEGLQLPPPGGGGAAAAAPAELVLCPAGAGHLRRVRLIAEDPAVARWLPAPAPLPGAGAAGRAAAAGAAAAVAAAVSLRRAG